MKLDSPTFKLSLWIAWIGTGISLYFRIRLMISFPDSRTNSVGPFVYSQSRALALGLFLFIALGILTLRGTVLNEKWKDPEFRKKTDWIIFATVALFLWVAFSWPWWLLAGFIIIPPLVVWERRKIANLRGMG